MECLICQSNATYFFSKKYDEAPFDSFMEIIGAVDYYKCTNCGFTLSKTHQDLSEVQWEKLNFDYHTHSEKAKISNKRQGNPPPYLEQAFMIKVLAENGIIDGSDMVDFAGGYGTLSNILIKYFKISLPVFDPYVQNNDRNIYISKENLGKYNTVINSALFEHITTRESFDEINDCVADAGCMIIHTVVCENIPNDANWFYMRQPVHCAFHTNKSMTILMEQWGYESSIYCPLSKCWVLLKKDQPGIQEKINAINVEFQTEYLIHKQGFVDFWKGF